MKTKRRFIDMSKTVNELAREALEWFETDTRDNGEKFVKTKDGRPDWLKTLIFTAHGDMMPDDYRYKFIEDALQYISDQDEDEDMDFPEIKADSYTSELTKWLHSRNDRVCYLTEALEEYEIKDGFRALQAAQLCEREEVYFSVLNSLRELCKDQEDEEEQED
jgi:hypothetical protein